MITSFNWNQFKRAIFFINSDGYILLHSFIIRKTSIIGVFMNYFISINISKENSTNIVLCYNSNNFPRVIIIHSKDQKVGPLQVEYRI